MNDVGFIVLGYILVFIVVAVAAGGGMGGGGVLVPIIMLTMGFDIKHAIPLSNATILGSSLYLFQKNMRRHHPQIPQRPLIDWELLLLMQPCTVAGAVTGSYINKVVPEGVLHLGLTAILIILSAITIRRAVMMYRKESEQMAEKLEEEGIQPEEKEEKKADDGGCNGSASIQKNDTASADGVAAAAADGVAAAAAAPGGVVLLGIVPAPVVDGTPSQQGECEVRCQMGMAFLVLFSVLTLNILKGGSTSQDSSSGIVSCGSAAYWVLSCAIFPVVISVSLYVRHMLLKAVQNRPIQPGEVAWGPINSLAYPALCFVVGTMSGMFGIGGGIMNGPLMLELGVIPEVASATSATLNLFTSTAATVAYVVFGSLDYYHGIALLCLGIFAALAGQGIFECIMQKWQRNSLIVIVISIIVVASAVLTVGQALPSFISDGFSLHTSGLCGEL